MTKLFDRSVIVTVDTIQITELQVKFTVKKSLKPEPNTLELRITNLNPKHRQALDQLKNVSVQLEAGYRNATSVLFLGDLRVTESSLRDGPDIVTTIGAGDGARACKTARAAVSIKGTAAPGDALRAVATAIGVGAGNLEAAVGRLAVVGVFPRGCVMTGNAAREMTHLCRSLSLEWSIQQGALQILPLGKALDGEAVVVSATSGMVGSPSIDAKGKLKVKMLMAPDIFPGRKIVLQGASLQGQFRVETTTHVGDLDGNDWYVDIEGQAY